MKQKEKQSAKERTFVFFTDFDGTFDDRSPKKMESFAKEMKEIQDKENVKVVFFPVTARPAEYVLAIMDDVNAAFKENGIHKLNDYAAAEAGGRILDRNDRDEEIFVADRHALDMSEKINNYLKDLKKTSYGKNFTFSRDFATGAFISLKSDDPEQWKEIHSKMKADVEKMFPGEKFAMGSPWKMFEIHGNSFDKAGGIEWYLNKLKCENKEIAGIVYCGDSGNDKPAIEYALKLKEAGICANAIVPSNSRESIKGISVNGHKPYVAQTKTLEGLIEGLRFLRKERKLVQGEKEKNIQTEIAEGKPKDNGTNRDKVNRNISFSTTKYSNSQNKLKELQISI